MDSAIKPNKSKNCNTQAPCLARYLPDQKGGTSVVSAEPGDILC